MQGYGAALASDLGQVHSCTNHLTKSRVKQQRNELGAVVFRPRARLFTYEAR